MHAQTHILSSAHSEVSSTCQFKYDQKAKDLTRSDVHTDICNAKTKKNIQTVNQTKNIQSPRPPEPKLNIWPQMTLTLFLM